MIIRVGYVAAREGGPPGTALMRLLKNMARAPILEKVAKIGLRQIEIQ